MIIFKNMHGLVLRWYQKIHMVWNAFKSQITPVLVSGKFPASTQKMKSWNMIVKSPDVRALHEGVTCYSLLTRIIPT